MNKEELLKCQSQFESKSAFEILEWANGYFPSGKVALSSGLGPTSQIITHMLVKINPAFPIFTVDPGRLHKETYELLAKTQDHFSIKIEVITPDPESVANMVNEYGLDMFYESAEMRKLCCSVRKVEPFKRKISTLQAWISGLRRGQSDFRKAISKVQWDDANNLIKINPLADWTQEEVWKYIEENHLPYNPLHDRGYLSIGCAPCTRAVTPGESMRSGRWWWELHDKDKKECGLHVNYFIRN